MQTMECYHVRVHEILQGGLVEVWDDHRNLVRDSAGQIFEANKFIKEYKTQHRCEVFHDKSAFND